MIGDLLNALFTVDVFRLFLKGPTDALVQAAAIFRLVPLENGVVTGVVDGCDVRVEQTAHLGIEVRARLTGQQKAPISINQPAHSSSLPMEMADPEFDQEVTVYGDELISRGLLDAQTRQRLRNWTRKHAFAYHAGETCATLHGKITAEAIEGLVRETIRETKALHITPEEATRRLSDQVLSRDRPEVRIRCFELLSRLRGGTSRLEATSREALRSEEPEIALLAAGFLGSNGQSKLVELFTSREIPVSIRVRAHAKLRSLATGDPLKEALRLVFGRPGDELRGLAATSLNELGHRPSGVELADAAWEVFRRPLPLSEDGFARPSQGFSELLGLLRFRSDSEVEERLVSWIPECLDEPGVLRPILAALERIGTPKVVPQLLTLQKSAGSQASEFRSTIDRIQEPHRAKGSGGLSLTSADSGGALSVAQPGGLTITDKPPK